MAEHKYEKDPLLVSVSSEKTSYQPSATPVNGGLVVGSTLSFHNITYNVQTRSQELIVLDNVSGEVKPGELCCIMGPSGAGKTSLLDALSCRLQTGKLSSTSNIEIDGQPLLKELARSRIAYVPQEDAVLPTTTPREALNFSAKLRLPTTVTDAKRQDTVEKMISRLGLSKCADSMVGGLRIRGISGGEKKRTSIGVELVTDPSVVFLDEPTSGLDSYAALELVKLLKDLCKLGCTVLCTIHQPSSEIFSIFDRVFLLASGKLMYGGNQDEMIEYFAGMGHKCPAHYNPADFFLTVAQTVDANTLDELARNWNSRGPAERSWSELGSNIQPIEYKRHTAGFFTQLGALTGREFSGILRNKIGLFFRFFVTGFLGLLFGLIYKGAGKLGETPDDARTHFGAVIQILISAMFGSAQPVLLQFPLERPVFMREYSTATYGILPYFLSKTVSELVVNFAVMSVAVAVPYYIMELQGGILYLIIVAFALSVVSGSIALVLGCGVKEVKSAQEFTPLIFVPQILFAGFFIKMTQIPYWLRWAQYTCALKFATNLGLIVEFGGSAGCPSHNATSPRCIASRELLESNDVEIDQWYLYAGIMGGLFVVFRTLAAIFLAARAP
eukprot:m.19507 g.19507  ORF g.19507 m.19507 type:complete len:614 (-) comp6603_c0_seq1:201-2042(-)